MAQQLLWSWTDDDSTFNLNRRDVGILEPGLYRGFDAQLAAGMTLNLVHTSNGARHVELDLDITQNIGVVLSNQGVVVKEDGPISLVVSPNNSANPRIDLIVMLHEYVEVAGGQPATYAIIQGTASATPVPPFLTDAARQVVLGKLYLPGNTTSLDADGVVYTKELPPMLGADPTIMRTTLEQHSIATKLFSGLRFEAEGMSYSGGTKTASAEKFRNIYQIPFVTNSAFEIVNLSLPSKPGHWFNIYVQNSVILKTTGNMIMADSSGDVYIEAGEMLTVLNLASLTAFFGPSDSYLVFRGGQANRSNDNKYYKMQSFTKGTLLAGPGAGSLNHQGAGNSFTLSVEADYDLKWIKRTTTNTSGLTDHDSGTVILVQVVDTRDIVSPPPIVIKAKHAVSSPPTDYKSIWCPNQADYTLKSGDWLMLVEYDDYWRLVNVFGGGQNNLQWWIDNFSAQVESVVESKELQYTKLQSWDWASLPSINFDVLSKSVWITDEANGFHITIPWEEEIWDIKILRSGVPVAVQKGTWIALKTNLNTELPGPSSYIRTGGSTNIFCVDKSVSSKNVKIIPGGVYIFIKTDTKWELVSYSQEQQVRLDAHDVTLADHTALIAEKADIAQENWHYVGTAGEPPFNLDFSNPLSGNSRCRFMKDTLGFVHLTGVITKGSGWNFGDVMFTLPDGYRPDKTQFCVAGAWTGTGFMSYTTFAISSNGDVYFAFAATWAADNDLQFDSMAPFKAV